MVEDEYGYEDEKISSTTHNLNQVLSMLIDTAKAAGFGSRVHLAAMKLVSEVIFFDTMPIEPGKYKYSPAHLAHLRQHYSHTPAGEKLFAQMVALNSRIRDITDMYRAEHELNIPAIAVPGSTALN